MFFNGWESLLRTLVIGVLAYVMLPDALRQARVTEDELRAADRAQGLASLKEADALVLETDGSFSVVRAACGSDLSTLDGVKWPGR